MSGSPSAPAKNEITLFAVQSAKAGDGRSDEEKNSIFSAEFHSSNENHQQKKSEESKSR